MLLALCGAAHADWTQTARLNPSASQPSARFGESVACSGRTVVVAAPWYDSSVYGDLGSVLRYEKISSTWYLIGTHSDSGGHGGAILGRGLDYDGAAVVAGEPGHTSNAGRLIRQTTTSTGGVTRATSGDRNANDYYGWSVATDGSLFASGAPGDDQGGTNSGAAYVYRTSGGFVKITGPSAGADFGRSIALHEDLLVVGAPNVTTSAGYDGAVYVYRIGTSGIFTTATLLGVISNPGAYVTNFGQDVAISGERVVVGHNTAGMAGRVYVYDVGVSFTTPEVTLTPPETEYGMDFGEAVAVDGDTVVVGSPSKDYSTTRPDVGAVYTFEKLSTGVWLYRQKLLPSVTSPSGGDSFGQSVDLSGALLVAGAPGANSAAGRAFVFEK